ncbi:MAG: arginine--tRNA ligase [Halobacteriota archaeon]
MFLSFRSQVKAVLVEALQTCGFPSTELALEVKPDYADLTSLVAFKLAPVAKRQPVQIARAIADHIRVQGFIGRVEVTGPYINFFVSESYLHETLRIVLEQNHQYGHIGAAGTVILEHTSANPNGPLHIGHIRNSVIGDTLKRSLQHAGYDVETQYYVNNMGRQIALVVWGMMHYELDETKKPDHATADVYIQANADIELQPSKIVEVRQLMQSFERGDEDIKRLFDDAVQFCICGITDTLKDLCVIHDAFIWESEFLDDIDGLIDELNAYETVEEDGAIQIDLRPSGVAHKLVMRRSDGTSVYAARDIAYHVWKAGRCHRMIDVLGADHKLNTVQIGAVLDLLTVKPPEIVFFEFVSLPEGSMSTRRGHFVSADEVLARVVEKAYEEVEMRRPTLSDAEKRSIAKAVGIGATRYDLLKVSAEKPMVFDWAEALDFERQGAPFLQYAHARARNILIKTTMESGFDPGLLSDPYERKLIKLCAAFPAIIEDVALNLRVNVLAAYARELAEAFNQFYRYLPVLSAEPPMRRARVALVRCVRIVLRNTLNCLGIEPIESM